MLGNPDVISIGVNDEALRIAVPIAPNLRPHIGSGLTLFDERIVDWYAAVIMESNDRAVVV